MAAMLLFAGFASGHAQQANATDLFTVSAIPVDANAASEVAAKAQAVAQGQRQGLETVFRRLTRQADWPNLPEATVTSMERFLRDISFAEERFGGGRYLAKLTARYEPDSVREALRDRGIAFTEEPAPPMVVVPIDRTGGGTPTLWEDVNPWRDAWLNRTQSEGLVQVVAPLGDLGDATTISAAQALEGGAGTGRALAERYGARGVVVAVVDTGAAGGASIAVNVLAEGWPAKPMTLRAELKPGDLPDAIHMRAVEAVMAALAEEWKGLTVVDPAAGEGSLIAVTELTGLPDWIAMEKRLKAISAISAVQQRRMTLRQAEVEIRYRGTLDRMLSITRANGIVLTPPPPGSGDGQPWQLGAGG